MNLRFFLTLPFFLLLVFGLHAQPVSQPLPASTHIEHYALPIGYDVTTVLIFPASIRPGDKGKSDREFIVQKQQGIENVLKLKAARRDFTPSNLHVFTSDGKIYAFDISYSPSPGYTTYDLRKLPPIDRSDTANQNAGIIMSNIPFDDTQIQTIMAEVKASKAFFSKKRKKYLMTLELQTIQTRGDYIFFGFSIKNKSDLGYPIDFVRTYITDQQKIKRASNQQTEIIPTISDTGSIIGGRSAIRYVIGVPRFTLADHKQFRVELNEKEGARNLVLIIHNKQLLRAKPL